MTKDTWAPVEQILWMRDTREEIRREVAAEHRQEMDRLAAGYQAKLRQQGRKDFLAKAAIFGIAAGVVLAIALPKMMTLEMIIRTFGR